MVAGIYVAFAVGIWFGADRLIFLPPDAGPAPAGELRIPTAGGERIAVRYELVEGATFTAIYFHGNAEDLDDVASRTELLHSIGVSTLAVDERGYGRSDGSPSEANAYEDADAAYGYLLERGVEPRHILVVGRSLGGAIAIDLASRRRVGGLVVESTFTTAFGVALPFPILPFDEFRSIDKIGRVRAPVLVMHGLDDDQIDADHGRALFAAAAATKRSLWVAGAGHQDLLERAGDRYRAAVTDLVDLMRAG